MDIISFRTLLQYIERNDLNGLRTILDTHHSPIDDRDEVITLFFHFLYNKFCEI